MLLRQRDRADVGSLFGNASPSRVVSVRVSDGRVVPLTDSLSPNLSPVWSPDGRWLYYVSNRYGPRDIFAQAMSGGAPRGPALRLTTGLNAHTISLSADGRRIAYAGLAIESNAWSIAVPAHLPGSASSAVQLTHGSQFVEAAMLSRDGRWLYYDSDLSGNMDLYRMALPGGAPERLTTDSSDDFWPAPSPDGREVAFHSWRGGLARHLGDAARRRPAPAGDVVARPGGDGPRGRPTGIGIAYCDLQRPGRHLDGAPGRTASGRSRSQRLGLGVLRGTGRPTAARWPFSSSLTRGSLWVMPADSGPPRLLADTTGPRALLGGQAQWSDDGRAIYTRNTDSTGTTFWRIPIDGGAPERLVTLEGGRRASAGGARGRPVGATRHPKSGATCGSWRCGRRESDAPF